MTKETMTEQIKPEEIKTEQSKPLTTEMPKEEIDAFIKEKGFSPVRRPCIMTPIARSPVPEYNASYQRTLIKYPVPQVTMVGHANTPRARNITLHQAMEPKDEEGNPRFTDFIFIDDDISWDVEQFFELVRHPPVDPEGRPAVICGAPQRRTDDVKFCCNVDRPGDRQKWGRLVSGKAATAFMRIPIEVINHLKEVLTWEEDGDKLFQFQELDNIWPFFDYKICDLPGHRDKEGNPVNQYMGEDFYFCDLVRENGGQVWIDPEIKLEHWHMSPLKKRLSDYIDYDGEQQGRLEPMDQIWGDTDPYWNTKGSLDIQGWRTKNKLLEEACQGAKHIAEVGVWKGSSIYEMSQWNPDAQFLAIDTFRGSAEHWKNDIWQRFVRSNGCLEQFLVNMKLLGISDRVCPLPMDSVNAFAYVSDKGWRFDMIHIDGGHDFQSVGIDLAMWTQLTDKIVLDDYDKASFPQLVQAAELFLQSSPDNWQITDIQDGKALLVKGPDLATEEPDLATEEEVDDDSQPN